MLTYLDKAVKRIFAVCTAIAALGLTPLFTCLAAAAGPIIADHNCTNISSIPATAIEQAKSRLRIAYGHTSHGSQLIDGMSGLVGFMNGLGYPADLYAFNSGGTGGALDLRDTPFSGADDLGAPDRTAWAGATRDYLNNHPEVNVIIWSWCGEVDGSQAEIQQYLDLMNGLELEYPNVRFVYMTGHLNGTGASGNVNLRNQQIRNYCATNNKILYDFADIESYDPGGLVNYMPLLANDACDYDSDGNGSLDKNWAVAWQNTHTVDVDWYNCGSAHSQPLNANRKAYAAWWLWAKLADWSECLAAPSNLTANADNINKKITLNWQDNSAQPNENSFIIQRQIDSNNWNNAYAILPSGTTVYTDTGLVTGTYRYRIVAHLNDAGSGQPCDSAPSNTIVAQIVAQGPPPAPTALTTQMSGPDVQLNWRDNANNETGMVVERHIEGQGFSLLTTLPANTVTYTDNAPTPNHTYYYRVKARNGFGDSAYSNEAYVYVPTTSTTIRLENTTQVDDTFLDPANPDTNYGNVPYVSQIEHFIIKFNLPAQLQDKKIVDASVWFYGWSQSGFPAGQYLDLYRVTSDWDELAATWNRRSGSIPWATPGGDYDSANMLGRTEFSSGCDHCFYAPISVTSIVQRWVDGTLSNFGLMLTNDSTAETGLKASEYSDGARPYLSVTYTPCPVNSDSDTDVDGKDLAAMAMSFDGSCLNAIAQSFGR